jgi:uncharacterized protein
VSLKDTLMSDLKTATLARDERRKGTIRLARGAIRYAEIAEMHELDDAGVLGVLAKEVKQRRESITEYEKAGREDLAKVEREEMDILMSYMPSQLSHEEIVDIAKKAISEAGATGPRDIGRVMPAVISLTKGRADGRQVSETVRELLAGGTSPASGN